MLIRTIITASILVMFSAFAGIGSAVADRLKDMTSIAGVRSNQLVGYGLVVGFIWNRRRKFGPHVAIFAINGISVWLSNRCVQPIG